MKSIITYFEIAAFFSSVLAWPYLRKSSYLRLFPIILFLVFIVEVYQTFFNKPGTINAHIYNVQVPLQHLLYLYMLYLALIGKVFKYILGTALVLFVFSTLVTGFFFTQADRFNILAYCIGSVLIVIGIVLKYYELLQNPVDFNFLKDPFFYLLFAYLLFNVGTLPYFTMSNWLHFLKTTENIKQILINVMSVFNYILYGTYTTVFLWMILKEGSSLSQRQ
jgi:hypothetical protein